VWLEVFGCNVQRVSIAFVTGIFYRSGAHPADYGPAVGSIDQLHQIFHSLAKHPGGHGIVRFVNFVEQLPALSLEEELIETIAAKLCDRVLSHFAVGSVARNLDHMLGHDLVPVFAVKAATGDVLVNVDADNLAVAKLPPASCGVDLAPAQP
jgi:hypothetical protein